MKTSDLLLSSLSITEDEYDYKGLFILSTEDRAINMDMADLEKESKMKELKTFFDLEEDTADIKKSLMDMIIEKAHISSLIVEGEEFEEKHKKKVDSMPTGSFDIA